MSNNNNSNNNGPEWENAGGDDNDSNIVRNQNENLNANNNNIGAPDREFSYILNTQKCAFDPDCVGRINWDYLFTRCMRYPKIACEEDKISMERFLEDFFNNLGCKEKCSQHVENFSRTCPVNLNTRVELVVWVLQLQNSVNEKLGKEKISNQQFLDRYINQLTERKKSKNNNSVRSEKHEPAKVFDAKEFTMILVCGIVILGILFVLKWFWVRKQEKKNAALDQLNDELPDESLVPLSQL